MSADSTAEFEEIDGVEEITDAVDSALEEASQLESALDDALDKLSNKQEDLDDEQLDQIRSSFEQGLDDEWRALESATQEYEPGEFEDQLSDTIDDFNSILQRPEAESVIEELEEWLVENGTEPFSEEERDTLVTIAENKVESARDVLSDSKTSAERVLTRLENKDDQFVQLIREDISDVNTVGGMRNLSDDLTTIDSSWLYPWELDENDDPANAIRSTVDEMLQSQMGEIITESDSLTEVSTLVSERFDGVEDTLTQLEEDANRISGVHSTLLDSDFPEAADVALGRLEERLERAEHPDQLNQVLDGSIADFETIKHLTETDLERFEPDGYDVSEDLQQSVDTAETKAQDAASIRDDVFSDESIEDYTEVRSQFDAAVREAEEALDSISSQIKSDIGTSEQLADTFDLTEYDGSLNELKLNAERADQLDELLEIADEHEEIRSKIRSDIQEELDEGLGVLLEWALGRENTAPIEAEEIEQEADEHDMTRAEIIDGLLNLQEKGLIELTIRGT